GRIRRRAGGDGAGRGPCPGPAPAAVARRLVAAPRAAAGALPVRGALLRAVRRLHGLPGRQRPLAQPPRVDRARGDGVGRLGQLRRGAPRRQLPPRRRQHRLVRGGQPVRHLPPGAAAGAGAQQPAGGGQGPAADRLLHPGRPLPGRDRADVHDHLRPGVRPDERRPPRPAGDPADQLAGVPGMGPAGDHHHPRLALDRLHHDLLPGRSPEHPAGAVRGRPTRRCRLLAALLEHHPAAAAAGHRLRRRGRPDRGVADLRGALHPDQRRPRRGNPEHRQLRPARGLRAAQLRLRRDRQLHPLRVRLPGDPGPDPVLRDRPRARGL
ncbi:MAG: ABC transporter, permease protein 1 (cluster 1, maltose/g3p/polyamine/iron), partial [uncultured Thermomicrobiales bacterium]